MADDQSLAIIQRKEREISAALDRLEELQVELETNRKAIMAQFKEQRADREHLSGELARVDQRVDQVQGQIDQQHTLLLAQQGMLEQLLQAEAKRAAAPPPPTLPPAPKLNRKRQGLLGALDSLDEFFGLK